MNSWQADRINTYSELWTILKEVYDENFDNWGTLTKDEVLHSVMKKSKGHFNPRIVKTIIDNL